MGEDLHTHYPPNSAGRRMVSNIPFAKKDASAGSVLDSLVNKINDFKSINYIYVVEDNKKLVGVVSLRDLLKSPKNAKLSEIMKTNIISAQPDADQEKVADLAVKHNIKAIPIVKNKVLLGVVPNDAILSILNRALREDVLHLAGIHKAHLEYENTLEVPLHKSILHRLPWLLVGLLGIVISAVFMGFFEETIQKYVLLALFIPAIVYMSDALGTQHQTLFVRDLAILGKELDLKEYFVKQVLIAAIIGLILALLTFLLIVFFWKQPFVAFVIALSMFVTLVLSGFSALATTFVIKNFKLDPALGSGPFATVVSDVSSIIIYFLIASTLIGL